MFSDTWQRLWSFELGSNHKRPQSKQASVGCAGTEPSNPQDPIVKIPAANVLMPSTPGQTCVATSLNLQSCFGPVLWLTESFSLAVAEKIGEFIELPLRQDAIDGSKRQEGRGQSFLLDGVSCWSKVYSSSVAYQNGRAPHTFHTKSSNLILQWPGRGRTMGINKGQIDGPKRNLIMVPLYLTFVTFSPVEVPAPTARKMSARPLCHSAFAWSNAVMNHRRNWVLTCYGMMLSGLTLFFILWPFLRYSQYFLYTPEWHSEIKWSFLYFIILLSILEDWPEAPNSVRTVRLWQTRLFVNKTEFLGLNSKSHVWRKPDSSHINYSPMFFFGLDRDWVARRLNWTNHRDL